MPLLAKECSLYPPQLLETTPSTLESESSRITLPTDDLDDATRWFAIYTKARQEKALARELLQQKTPFFLPIVASPRKIRGKVTESFLPLFSGYVFVQASRRDVFKHLATKRISTILEVGDQKQLQAELSQLATLIESSKRLTVESRLVEGDRVRIRNGALKGVTGVIVQRRGRDCILVAVTYLGQGVSVEIEDFCVDPA